MSGEAAWRVERTDDNGVRSTVAQGLSRAEAETLVERLAARGHKQLYEAVATPKRPA